jgi:hypothetical protein
MHSHKIMLVTSLVFSILGFISLSNFESMASWGEDTMVWFWVGAIFTYICIFNSLLFIYQSNRKGKSNRFKVVAQLIIASLSIYTFIWTSFIVYIWYFKDFSF